MTVKSIEEYNNIIATTTEPITIELHNGSYISKSYHRYIYEYNYYKVAEECNFKYDKTHIYEAYIYSPFKNVMEITIVDNHISFLFKSEGQWTNVYYEHGIIYYGRNTSWNGKKFTLDDLSHWSDKNKLIEIVDKVHAHILSYDLPEDLRQLIIKIGEVV